MRQFVFVLGAGASRDLRLPMGAELTQHIKTALSFGDDGYNLKGGDQTLSSALSNSGRRNWFEASRLIAAAMPLAPSIDNFVDVHRNDEDVAFCAKVAIAKCILDAERGSTTYVDPRNAFNTIDFQGNIKAWHTLFFRILTTNCILEDLPKRLQSIGIISFNYDRCFEHFLFHAIKTYYRINDTETAAILKHLEIYHPYGKVGELPFMANVQTVPYGAKVSVRDILEISKQIRTFTETVDNDSNEVKSIRSMLNESLRLVFLGFAYHDLNVRFLFPNVSPSAISFEKRIIGTAMGSSKSDLTIIGESLRVGYRCDRAAVELRNDLTCDALFTEYSRTLSLA